MKIKRITIYKCEKYKAFEEFIKNKFKLVDQTLCQEIYVGGIR